MWTIFTFQFHDLHEKHKNLRPLVESDELRDVNFSGFAFIFELNEACERNFLGSNFFPSSQGGKFIFISRPWNFLSSHTLITDCPIFIASISLWMIWILFRLRVFVMKTGRSFVEQSNSCVNFQGNLKKTSWKKTSDVLHAYVAGRPSFDSCRCGSLCHFCRSFVKCFAEEIKQQNEA